MNERDREQMTTDLRRMWIRRAVDGVELDQRGIASFAAAVVASHKFDAWLAAIRTAAWDEAIAEAQKQGTIQTPDNPHLRRDQ